MFAFKNKIVTDVIHFFFAIIQERFFGSKNEAFGATNQIARLITCDVTSSFSLFRQ